MAVVLYIPSAFDAFPDEAAKIGRLVTEYGVVEYDFCLMVGSITGDRDAALKAMYRVHSESQRIDIGDALGRHVIPTNRRQLFETIVADLHISRKIRNQYAHAQWVEAAGKRLCFVNLEEIARSNAPVREATQTLYHVTADLLAAQGKFFYDVCQNIRYLNMEAQMWNGERDAASVHYVDPVRRPPIALKATY